LVQIFDILMHEVVPVLRIHDILIRIRIPLFHHDLQEANKKLILLKDLCLLLFEGTFTSFFKDKKSKRSHKTEGGINVFLTIFA